MRPITLIHLVALVLVTIAAPLPENHHTQINNNTLTTRLEIPSSLVVSLDDDTNDRNGYDIDTHERHTTLLEARAPTEPALSKSGTTKIPKKSTTAGKKSSTDVDTTVTNARNGGSRLKGDGGVGPIRANDGLTKRPGPYDKPAPKAEEPATKTDTVTETYDLESAIARFDMGSIKAKADDDKPNKKGKSRVLSAAGVHAMPADLAITISPYEAARVPDRLYQLSNKTTFNEAVTYIEGAFKGPRDSLPGEAGMAGVFLQDVTVPGQKIVTAMFNKVTHWWQVGSGPAPQTDLLLNVGGENISLIEIKTQLAMNSDHVQSIFDYASKWTMAPLKSAESKTKSSETATRTKGAKAPKQTGPVMSLVDPNDPAYEKGTQTRETRAQEVIMLEQVIAQMYAYDVDHAALTNFDYWLVLKRSGSNVVVSRTRGRTDGSNGRSKALDIILDLSFKGLLPNAKSDSMVE